MAAWMVGGIGAGAAAAGGLLGFVFCRWKWPSRESVVDGGAILGVLFGFPIGYLLGLAGALAGARAVAPFAWLPAIGLGLLPLGLVIASLFVVRSRVR